MKNIKVKPLTKSQILISIDRLTRFKNTETKYHRVFFDILTHNLLEPHLKKSDLECLPSSEIKSLVELILNTSLEALGISNDFDYSLNAKLREYEQSIFQSGHETLELLDNKINYKGCLSLIDNTAPQNLLWLKSLFSVEDIKLERNKRSLKFPIEMVLLAEGATEEILLPEISKLYDFDFDKEGIYLYPAGGKNQVVKSYYELCEQLKIPIFVLLDKDGEENSKEIKRLENILEAFKAENAGGNNRQSNSSLRRMA